jgi:hypothetical protein
MVSEDSDQVVSGFPSVHRLSDLCDLEKTRRREMTPMFHELNARRKLLEVRLLRCPERKPLEERDDPLDQIRTARNDVLTHVLPVVVMTPAGEQSPALEETLKLFENRWAARSLRHGKPRGDLVSDLVASPAYAVSLPHEANREASFSVYKTDHPATQLDQSFLLIVRTRHVVTVDIASDVTSSARYTGFPAFGQMHTAPLPMRGAAWFLP